MQAGSTMPFDDHNKTTLNTNRNPVLNPHCPHTAVLLRGAIIICCLHIAKIYIYMVIRGSYVKLYLKIL